MKTLAAFVIGAALSAMLVGSYTNGCREAGYRAGVRKMQSEALLRNCGQWSRDDDGTNKFQWIVKLHSSQRDRFPDDVFVANDEVSLSSN